MTATMTQAEFARHIGVAKSYISKLKDAGRLVMTPEGMVNVDESKQRIAATADPGKDDVSAKWKQARDSHTQPTPPAREEDSDNQSYQAARADKERYAAKMAKIEYERAIGKLVDKAEVQAVVEDVITQFRQGLENLPYRLAPELVGQDLDGIRAALKQEIFDALGKMQRGFVRQMDEIGKTED